MSLIAWTWPAKPKRRGRPVSPSRARRACSRWFSIGCLSLLTMVSSADSPESPGVRPSETIPPDAAQILPADKFSGKTHGGNSPATSQFEEPPQKIDFFKLELLQHQAAENREQSRKRIKVPGEALLSQAVVDPASLPNVATEIDPHSVPHWRVYAGLNQGLLAMVLVTLAGVLVARKLVPEFSEWINATLNPWTMTHAVDFETSAIAMEEEKSFSEFKARFRVGTGASRVVASPAPFDGHDSGAEFLVSAGRHIERIQSLVKEARLTTIETAQRKCLREAYEKLQGLKSLVANPRLKPLEQMTCALELLMKQLTEKAGAVTSSTLRTATQGMEVLAELCVPELNHDLLTATPLRLLVVDDEMFSRFALSTALKRTLAAPEIAEHVEAALALVGKHTYDLIFLDVMMPGMDGFELCAKIHETAQNRLTPVVFVTSLRDFDTRAKSIVCGARDIISKPFLTFELTVKALTLVTRERLKGRGSVTTETMQSITCGAPDAGLPQTINLIPVQAAPAQKAVDISDACEAMAAASPLAPKPTRVFLAQAKAQAAALRELLDSIERSADAKAQRKMLNDLYARVHSFAVGAEACEQHALSQIGSALAGLLKKLLYKSVELQAPTLQTMAGALSLIQDLCEDDPDIHGVISAPIDVLAVDDDPIARRYMTNALQLKFLLPQSAVDGKTAVELAADKTFDVIFLDVQMPDLDGFTVCKQIRQSTANRHTPVVFVTSHYEPAMKAQALACQGNDFISKPYICSELTVKTITSAFRNRLAGLDDQVDEPIAATN